MKNVVNIKNAQSESISGRKSRKSEYDLMPLETLLAQEIDAEMPMVSLEAYLRRCQYFERRGSFQVKQLRYRIGRVLAIFRVERKKEGDWETWVETATKDVVGCGLQVVGRVLRENDGEREDSNYGLPLRQSNR